MLQMGWIHQEFFPETSSNVLYYRRTLLTLRKNVCESKLTQCGGHDKLYPNLEVLVGTSRTTRSWVPQKGIVPPKTPVLSLLGVPTVIVFWCVYIHVCTVYVHVEARGLTDVFLYHSSSYVFETTSLTEPGAYQLLYLAA